MDEVGRLSRRTGWRRTCRRRLPPRPRGSRTTCGSNRREWLTEIGPVDLMCRDLDDGWVAVEIKRVGTIDAVEQLTRYLGFIRADPAKAACRGILAAQFVQAAGGHARRVARDPVASRSTSPCSAASASLS